MHDFYDPDDDVDDGDAESDIIDDDEPWMLDRTEAWWLREQDRLDRIEHATSGYWRRRREHMPRGACPTRCERIHPRRYRGRHGDRRQAAREFPEAATREKRARLLRDPERLPF